MSLPALSKLSLDDAGTQPPPAFDIPDDIDAAMDRPALKLKALAKALPYPIDSNAKMQRVLDLICKRLVQAVEAKDYDPGFIQWDGMLT